MNLQYNRQIILSKLFRIDEQLLNYSKKKSCPLMFFCFNVKGGGRRFHCYCVTICVSTVIRDPSSYHATSGVIIFIYLPVLLSFYYIYLFVCSRPPNPQSMAGSAAPGGGLFSQIKGGAGSFLKNLRDTSSKVVHTVQQ